MTPTANPHAGRLLISSAKALLGDAGRLCGHRTFKIVLTVLLAVDAVLLTLHVLSSLDHPSFSGFRFKVSADRGYGEMMEYGMAAASAASMLVLGLRLLQPAYLMLSALFTLHFLDNFHRLHESFGAWLGPALVGLRLVRPAAGLAIAELVYFLGLSTVVLAAAVLALRRSAPDHRRRALVIIAGLGALGAAAVGVDFLHSLAAPALDGELALIEDGLELIILSASAAAAAAVYVDAGRHAPSRAREASGDSMSSRMAARRVETGR